MDTQEILAELRENLQRLRGETAPLPTVSRPAGPIERAEVMSSKSNKSEQARPIPSTWGPEGNTMLDLFIALGSPKRNSFTQVSDLNPQEKKLDAIKEWREIRKCACDLFGHEQFEGETWDRLVEWLEEKHGKKWNAARPSSASPHGRPEDDTLGTELAQVLDWLEEAKHPAEGTGADSDQAEAEQADGSYPNASNKIGNDEPFLYPKHIIILVALLELGAVGANKRTKLREIIQHHNRKHVP